MFNNIHINQKNLLLSLYIIILGVFVPAIYWIGNRDIQSNGDKKEIVNPIQKRISLGSKILVAANNNQAKQAGVEAFANGDYVTASEKFYSALSINPNDPEALIYLNNTLAAKTENAYEIAVSVPIGGNLNVAQEILRGVAQAQNEVNKNGGINGKLLMVKIANDDNNPEIAREIANRLVEDEQVLAVIGHSGSNASIAAAPIYQENGMVMITPTSSAEVLSTMGDYIFRSTPSTRDLAETLAEYAVKTARKENISMCVDSDAQASVSFKENFTWAVYNHGGKVIPVDCDLAKPNLLPTEVISQAVSKGSDALLLAPSVRKIDKAMEIVAANNDRLTLFGNHSMSTYQTLKQGQQNVNNMVLTVAWYSPDSENSFTADARQLWGGGVNWRTAMAHDATKTLSKAIAFGSQREEIQQALADPQFSAQGASSSVSFLPTGDRNLRGTIIEVEPGNKSGTGYDFVPVNAQQKEVERTKKAAK